jgi:hypothetical protein
MSFDTAFHVLWVTTYNPAGWVIGGVMMVVFGAGLLAHGLMRVW